MEFGACSKADAMGDESSQAQEGLRKTTMGLRCITRRTGTSVKLKCTGPRRTWNLKALQDR